MSGRTLPQTHSADVWEQPGNGRHSAGHGWPHVPPIPPPPHPAPVLCVSWYKFRTPLLLSGQWAACPNQRIACRPPLLPSFSLLSSHPPSFSSLFSFPKHMLTSWLGDINNSRRPWINGQNCYVLRDCGVITVIFMRKPNRGLKKSSYI